MAVIHPPSGLPFLPLGERIFDCPLDGINLLEASAGTGKTYSIETLLLRLLVEKQYRPDAVLVVTFTEAATKELRERVRLMLRKALDHAHGRLADDDPDAPRISRVLNGAAERAGAATVRATLQDALYGFDDAAIHTIHGFCARVLAEQPLESRALFDSELATDRSGILHDVVDDFCRQHLFSQSPLASAALHRAGLDLAFWRHLADTAVRRPDATIVPASPGISGIILAKAVGNAVGIWRQHRDILAPFLGDLSAGKALRKAARGGLPSHLEALDAWRPDGTPAGHAAVLDALAALSTTALTEGLTKKGAELWAPPPEAEALFTMCDHVGTVCEEMLLTVKSDAIRFVRERYAVSKRAAHVHTFDDLLTDLREALEAPDRGAKLATQLRTRYRAALIDEFQDTDPVQYRIFERIFVEGHLPLFLVGDPKQAIYSFRNGDIFTYCDAAATVARPYSLGTNYRSERALVDAVNTLFSTPEGKPPFATDFINFQAAAAAGKAPGDALHVNGAIDPAPLKLWFHSTGEKAVSKSLTEEAAHRAVAAEIARLLADSGVVLPHTDNGVRVHGPVRPSDIAVLVTAHRQARGLQQVLAAAGIQAVVQSTGSVFDTAEAQDLRRVLAALAQPSDQALVRGALTTTVFGVTADRLAAALTGSSASATDTPVPPLEDPWSEIFRDAHQLWQRDGFMAACSHLLRAADTRRRLLRRPQGERRLANVLQLIEILHGAAQEHDLGPAGVLTWFDTQLEPQSRSEQDDYEMRLDSDRDAVHVLTVFRSKGLQFPIVFVPYMWALTANVSARAGSLTYHRRRRGRHELVLDLAPDRALPVPGELPPGDQASDECLAEHLRLLYVALTRGIHRTYLFWGHVTNSEATALSYLLHARPPEAPGVVRNLTAIPLARKLEDVDRLTGPGTAIEAVSVAPVPTDRRAGSAATPATLAARARRNPHPPDAGWRIVSFSSLSPHADDTPAETAGLYDFDAVPQPSAAEAAEARTGIFAFPAGIRTGNCWHALFEELDFQADAESIGAAARRLLAVFGLLAENDAEASAQVHAVTTMVQAVLTAPLRAGASAPVLAAVPRSDRLSELEFTFPLRPEGLRTADIRAALASDWPRADEFGERLTAWDERVAGGFMTGNIDLVFRSAPDPGGAPIYNIVDWKSNLVGTQPEDYSPEALTAVMGQHFYVLQYLFYTVALHRFLKRAHDNYDYDRNVGGVFYVFLRGVDAAVPGQGIYYDRPPRRLVDKLDAILGAP